MREPIEEAGRWFTQAKQDLSDARYLLEGERFNLVCFVCQQAAEKALKAYLITQGQELIFTHSVDELCLAAGEFDSHFHSLRKEISILDGYYVPTRYPNALPGGVPAYVYNLTAAQQALALAEKTMAVVGERIGLGK